MATLHVLLLLLLATARPPTAAALDVSLEPVPPDPAGDALCQPYSELFATVASVAAWWTARGGMAASAFQEAAASCGRTRQGCAHVKVHRGALYVSAVHGPRAAQLSRVAGQLNLLHQATALFSDPPLPDAELLINTDDRPAGPPWVSYCNLVNGTAAGPDWLMPDFSYLSWPSAMLPEPYPAVQKRIADTGAALTWARRRPQMYWRGAAMVPVRKVID